MGSNTVYNTFELLSYYCWSQCRHAGLHFYQSHPSRLDSVHRLQVLDLHVVVSKYTPEHLLCVLSQQWRW